MLRRRWRWLALGLLGALALAALWPSSWDRSGRGFSPERLADLEMGMWQDYYQRRNVALFRGLVVALREQFGYSWSTSLRAAFHLARAAGTFARVREPPAGAYRPVREELTAAFSLARDWMGAGWQPASVAGDELAWWVARRHPDQRSPENVGRLIGLTYAHFYDVPLQRVLQAGVLRARAADLRDRGGPAADWDQIRRLLRASYRTLREGVTGPPPPG